MITMARHAAPSPEPHTAASTPHRSDTTPTPQTQVTRGRSDASHCPECGRPSPWPNWMRALVIVLVFIAVMAALGTLTA